MPHPKGNRISLAIPDEDRQAIRLAIETLQQKLLPHLVDLDVEDRQALPKMGPKSVDFVARTLAHLRANPQFTPSFVDLDELGRDLDAVDLLRSFHRPLAQIIDMIDDSVFLSGSEAFAAALTGYQAIKAAAKVGEPGAALIADELGDRFQGRPRKGARPATADVGHGQPPVAPA